MWSIESPPAAMSAARQAIFRPACAPWFPAGRVRVRQIVPPGALGKC
jgi:hypothetical protein